MREPGRRGQPVGDLGLHHHQAVPQRRQQRHQVQQHRHGDVVGQVRDQRGGRRARDVGDPQRVGLDHLEAVRLVRGVRRDGGGQRARPAPGRPRPPRPGPPVSSSARVSEPRPGPTSRTTSSAPTPEARTIRRTVLGSMTKFWPRCLVGRSPSSSASRRTSAGPRNLGPAEEIALRRPTTRATLSGRQASSRRTPARRRSRPRRRDPLGDGDLRLAAVLVGTAGAAVGTARCRG